MAQVNPYYQQIADMEGAIASLQTRWATLNSQWLPYTQAGNYTDPVGQRILQERDAVAAQIEQKKKTLEQLRDAAAKYDAAVAANVASGMTPEAAALKAQTDMDRAALVNKIIKGVAIALVALGVVYGIVVFIRWKKKSK